MLPGFPFFWNAGRLRVTFPTLTIAVGTNGAYLGYVAAGGRSVTNYGALATGSVVSGNLVGTDTTDGCYWRSNTTSSNIVIINGGADYSNMIMPGDFLYMDGLPFANIISVFVGTSTFDIGITRTDVPVNTGNRVMQLVQAP